MARWRDETLRRQRVSSAVVGWLPRIWFGFIACARADRNQLPVPSLYALSAAAVARLALLEVQLTVALRAFLAHGRDGNRGIATYD